MRIGMEQMLSKLARIQYKYHKIIAVIAIILTLFLASGLMEVQFQGDITKEMPEDLPVFALSEKISDTFRGQETIFVVVCLNKSADSVEDLRDPRVLSAVAELQERLKREPSVDAVESVVSFVGIPRDYEEAKRIISANPLAKRFFNREYSVMLVSVKLTSGLAEEQVRKTMDMIQQNLDAVSKPPGVDFRITGTAPLVETLLRLMREDMLRTTLFTLLVLFFLLSLLQRSFLRGFFVFMPLLFALTWTFGTMGLLRIPISVSTAGIGAMIAGLGVEYGIFMVSRYYEEKSRQDSENAFVTAVASIGHSTLGSAATTAAGFLALLLSFMPLVQRLGLTLALGIIYCWIAAVVVNPCFVIWEDRWSERKQRKRQSVMRRSDDEGSKIVARGSALVRSYATQLSKHPLVFLLIFLFLLTPVMAFYASQAETKGMRYKEMLPEGEETIETYYLVEDQFAGSFAETTVAIEIAPEYANSNEVRDVRDPRVLRFADAITQRAKTIEGATDARSAADIVKMFNGGRIPSSLREVKEILSNEMAEELAKDYISDDYRMTLVRIYFLDDVDAEDAERELEGILSMSPPPGVKVEFTGDPVPMVPVMRRLSQETMQKTSIASISAILILLIVLFASVRFGLTPLLAILCGSIWTYGILVLAGYEISPQTSGVLSMIMGIGIDFGIQVAKRFRYELQLAAKRDAMRETMSSVFLPMCITTIAAIIGFQSLSLVSRLPFMSEMGTMMSLGVTCCMLAALTVVPATLLLIVREKDTTREEK